MTAFIMERMIGQYSRDVGIHTDEERREFVEQFVVYRNGDWYPLPGWRESFEQWFTEMLDTAILESHMGKVLRQALEEDLYADGSQRVLDAIYDIAGELD